MDELSYRPARTRTPNTFRPTAGFSVAAAQYTSRGFEPLPLNGKTPLVRGVTGRAPGADATQIAQWCTEYPDANTGLRLADDVIAIDVDHGYDGKTGADHLRDLEARLGPLPATYTSTSRGAESPSRQHFYRVPVGLHFRGAVCQDVELLQRTHRYAVVEPSVHPDTGQPYLWYGPDGAPGFPDSAEEFAELPAAWVDELQNGRADYGRGDYPPMPAEEVAAVCADLDRTGLPPDGLRERLPDVDLSTHDGAVSALGRLAWWIIRRPQTPGLGSALDEVYASRTGAPEALEDPARAVRRQRDLDRALADFLGSEKAEAEADRVAPGLVALVERWAREAAGSRTAETDFWDARPYLQHCRDSAYRRYFGPWALLGALMQRALMDLPYSVYYESRMGIHAINSMTAFVGTTGGGKSLTQRTLDDAFAKAGDDALRAPIRMGASGEGIMDAYVLREKVDVDPTTGKFGGWSEEWQTHNHAILWGYDEVGRLEGQNKRQGSTLLETFKEAWSGSTLTRSLAGKRATEVPANQYRFCMFVNVQPAKADVLLNDSAVDGGLTGRFLWLPVQNPTADADDPDGPVTTYELPSVSWTSDRIKALPEMEAAHKAAQIAAGKGERAAEDSHALLVRAFVAIALMALDGRSELNSEDWELAEVVMSTSRNTRDYVKGELSKATAKANQATAIASGTRQVIAAKVVATSLEDELYERWKSNPQWRRKKQITARLHPAYEAVKARLEAEGFFEETTSE